jgi:integrase
MQFYLKLLKEDDIELATLDNVHCLLHPTFQMAVRDDIIRKNPTDGAMAEVCKCGGKNRNSREALTMDQLRTFMGYIASHPIFCAWWPIFVVLFGTGLRAGEFVGLTWDDIDMEKRTISVNHTLSYYKKRGEKICRMHVHRPKTDAGIRLIPMLDSVKLAFEMAKEELEGCEYDQPVIDGLTNFVFLNKYSTVHNPQTLNREIKCIVAHYNAEEEKRALKEKRDPVLLPDFSLHICRHTFATRLVEVCTNLKVITSIMGHKSVETTMDIYADPSETKNNEIMGLLSDKMDDVF